MKEYPEQETELEKRKKTAIEDLKHDLDEYRQFCYLEKLSSVILQEKNQLTNFNYWEHLEGKTIQKLKQRIQQHKQQMEKLKHRLSDDFFDGEWNSGMHFRFLYEESAFSSCLCIMETEEILERLFPDEKIFHRRFDTWCKELRERDKVQGKKSNVQERFNRHLMKGGAILLSLCESAVERLFLLAIITSRDIYFPFLLGSEDPGRAVGIIKPNPGINTFTKYDAGYFGPIEFIKLGFNLYERFQIEVYPQYIVVVPDDNYGYKIYRLDFLIFVKRREIDKEKGFSKLLVPCDLLQSKDTIHCKINIEIDGHDFHERTKEQAKHDKARDNLLQRYGANVFRYTGSTIYNNVDDAVQEVFDFYIKKQMFEVVKRQGF